MTNFFSRNKFVCCLLVVGILVLVLSPTVVEGVGDNRCEACNNSCKKVKDKGSRQKCTEKCKTVCSKNAKDKDKTKKEIKEEGQKKIKKIKENTEKKIKAAAVGEKQKDENQKSEKEKRKDKIIQKNAKALLTLAAGAVFKKGESEKNENQENAEKNAEARQLLQQKKKQNIKAKKLKKDQKKAVKKANNMRKKVLKKQKKNLKKKIKKLQKSKQAAKNRAFAKKQKKKKGKKQGFENYQQRESFKNLDRREQDLFTIQPFRTIEPFFEALECPTESFIGQASLDEKVFGDEETDQGDIPDADKKGIEAFQLGGSYWSAAVKTKDSDNFRNSGSAGESFYNRYPPNPLPPGISEGFAVREGLAEGDTPKEVSKDAGGFPADGSHFRDNPTSWEPEFVAKARAWKHHLQSGR